MVRRRDFRGECTFITPRYAGGLAVFHGKLDLFGARFPNQARLAEAGRLPDLSKTPARMASMFDAIASRYDLLNHVLSAGFDWQWRRRAIRSLLLTGTERVVDLCTGTADLAIAARTARPSAARVVGVDFAGAMLRVGQRKLRARRLTDFVTLIRGDATRIPLARRSVHAVTIAFGLRNVDNTAAACAEMSRVLAPGGRLAILEFAIPARPGVRRAYLWYFNRVLPRIGRLVSRHTAAYEYLPASVGAFATPDEVVKLLRQAGFTDVTASPLTFGIVFLYTARISIHGPERPANDPGNLEGPTIGTDEASFRPRRPGVF